MKLTHKFTPFYPRSPRQAAAAIVTDKVVPASPGKQCPPSRATKALLRTTKVLTMPFQKPGPGKTRAGSRKRGAGVLYWRQRPGCPAVEEVVTIDPSALVVSLAQDAGGG